MLSAGGRCHTLDGRGDGYLRAEGTVGAALAPEENPAAELAASGAKAEGRSASLTAPNGSVQAQLLAETWDRLERDAPGFGYELHGTGTALGDPVEAAAGLAGFAACLRAAAADAAGPAAQLRRVNGHLGALLDGRPSSRRGVRAGAAAGGGGDARVSSFGFSGTIAHGAARVRRRDVVRARRQRVALTRDGRASAARARAPRSSRR
ncbi:phosphopantetheine binding protein [Aureococcus anophagefferens]|uniref:Phosphopantetheine binding protein n=1 Tax=Aureococcus anophagefferens TaxID=44056 RepID=A0ABR1G2H7_AURAN